MNAPASQVLRRAAALMALAEWLKLQGYRFVTPSRATHLHVNARTGNERARNLRDVFGWSRPFTPSVIGPGAVDWLDQAGLLQRRDDGLLQSEVRFATLHGELFAHSAFDAAPPDAVAFGPDSYRFCHLLCCELTDAPLPSRCRVLDVGCGAGPGGIVAAREQRHAEVELVLADRNPRALQFASVNAAIAGCDATLAEGDLYAPVEGKFDLIAANAGDHGAALAERIVREGLQRLGPQGRLVLHTHVAIVDGHDPLLEAIEPVLRCGGWRWRYAEMDPDISCGGSMDEGADAAMPERVAAVAVVVERAGR